MIKAADIPHFTGEPEALETDAEGVKKDATAFRTTGADIHKSFQGLSAFYEAPEAEALFASTQPVATQADDFADDLHDVGAALDAYASEVRPLKARLERLRTQAANFEASVEGEDDWQEDEEKVAKNNDLLHDVNSTVAALWAAERRAANTILRLVGKPTYKANDGSNKPGMYGYTGKQLDGAETPWGSAEEESHAWYEVDHWLAEGGRLAKEFVWDGFIVDGAGAALSGIGALVTLDGDAWSGLGDFFTGIGLYTAAPYDWAMSKAFGPVEESADEKRAKQTVVDFGKSMVAWDEWEKHPSKALGTTVFNGLTLGAGSLLKLGKAGEIASAGRTGALSKASEAATAAGKFGRIVDPMTHVFNGAGKLPKLRDVMQGIQHTDGFQMAGRADGSLHVAEDTFLHSDGTLRNGNGDLLEGTAPRQEPSAADLTSRAPDETPAPRPDHELAHVGADHGPPNAQAHGGDGSSPGTSSGPGADDAGSARAMPEQGGHGSSHGGGSAAGGSGDGTAHGPGSDGSGPGGGHADGSGADGGSQPGAEDGTGRPTTPGDGPKAEMAPQERVAHWDHLERVEQRSPDDFDHLQRDPDKNGGISDPSMDEARVGLDLRDQGKLPDDIRRPTEADHGEFYSPSTGEYYDIKGVHSDWPPFNNQRDRSAPFKGAYNPSKNEGWVRKLAGQIVKKDRVVILDVRNANQAAIDDIASVVREKGWGDRVIWYP